MARPSYVRYPAPEPYTAAPYNQDDDSWPADYLTDDYDINEVDILDGSQYPSAPILQDIPRLPSHIPRRTSYVQDIPRRPLGIPRRPSHAQGMPRTRYSYAPEIQKRFSNAERPHRRSSYNPQTQDLPNGQYKLWFNYLKDDPGYFSPDALERNKQQSKIWQARRGRNVPPSTPHHTPQHNYHHQAASRLSWI